MTFRNDIVNGPGGSKILLQDPAGNLVELFQPASAELLNQRGGGVDHLEHLLHGG